MRKRKRAGETARRILAHSCVICSMVIVTFQILDWYNPYMDFTGHAALVLRALCASALLLGFANIFGQERRSCTRRVYKTCRKDEIQ